MTKKKALGFGFVPEETQHHFLVIIPRGEKSQVNVYERFKWDEVEKPELVERNRKVAISKYKWDKIKDALKAEFNKRLTEYNIGAGKWKTGPVPVERLMGKEMVLLMWAIEDSDPSVIPEAINNWLGLTKEERWWLFTMTNASTGYAMDKRGWRKAIRYALTENPVEERGARRSLFEELFEQRVKIDEE